MSHVTEDVLQAVSQLECLDMAKSVLDMRVYDELYHTQYLTTEVESIAKSALLPLLSRQRFHRLQVEVVV